MISRFEQFSYVISGIHRQIQKIERAEMIKRGYKGAFAQYLATLHRYEAGLTATELCEICDKDKAAVSRILAEMEEKGLVEREKKVVRTYRSKITLTEKGRETAEFVAARAKLAISAVSDEVMDEQQREVLYSTLDALYKNLRKVVEEGLSKE
ncbi:MAG: MarR family transcriptional regulator [Oscillospiraceae bacterium]|nr:MarR family transcriptional regulator [Oscillospiraceae bacterium]MBQ3501323.1 MarR family transcriptional regulator [Oscillospiraceae bacterium]